MATLTTKDGTELYYKDWGAGPLVMFCHGWPLSSDSWDAHMLFLASNGFRCVAHDRRGHGRSSQPWAGNNMDTYADDLAAVLDAVRAGKAILVGFSTGGGEVARYVGRHGTSHVAKIALISAVTPFMLESPSNAGGVPMDVFDGLRRKSLADRSQLYKELAAGPFFGANRPGAQVSDGMREAFWLQGMQAGHRNTYECIAAFSETDFTTDLRKFDVPTLIVHGEDDQIVPIAVGGQASSRIVTHATFKRYPGAPHGLTHTHQQQLSGDLLAFARG